MSLKQSFEDIITTTSGDAVDITRVLSLIAFVTFIGLTVYQTVWLKEPLHYMDFGAGVSALIAAVGAAIRLNPENRQPPENNNDNTSGDNKQR